MKTWFKSGTPWIWLTGGAMTLCMVMVIGLLLLIGVRGFSHFWPAAIVETTYTAPGAEPMRLLGELSRSETLTAAQIRESGVEVAEDQLFVTRHLLKQGTRDQLGRDFVWYLADYMGAWHYPQDALMLERREWGNFYGYPVELREGDAVIARGADLPRELAARVKRSNDLFEQIRRIERKDIGDINMRLERIRLAERRLELRDDVPAAEVQAQKAEFEQTRARLDAEYLVLQGKLDQLYLDMRRDTLVAEIMDGRQVEVSLANIVRASQPNAMGLPSKLAYYGERLWEFIAGYPREANTEGGIFPAIFGTVTMVFVMSIMVTPFGILAAIYLREYAKQGPLLRLIRVSVYNLAGVPSIVFGVFGLGFFVYFIGGGIDRLFYPESLPAPTFGTPGLFWVSLTLALLTLPVVIVATEEGLARIPRTVREGSLALGATKAETLWRIVVPQATPAMMTGLILAIARAAGEVAPLMLVGVVKLAPTLPIDGHFPFIHLERKIMHLGFHIYDVGFQSPNVEAARPLVYATALTLVIIIVALNMSAVAIRNHLREKYRSESD
ncbi:phosphate transport system permease protein [Geoalkalibacter ferrihydriticus]|uniref:Phosphate transport system permease protein PstA n=2 Tax=Geoalkalibacter ferrihydriticus TaxID=392333 RepID=A0A0C2HSY0_9BACT|nr:phosphate ABC transporter permease PstA [Geoalkalibacter ferrihydriticus]KIH75892.1 phosphate ABC transporter permease [Geoalkalibacter ferrihydriticus DSM 17813]SDM53659.1 phosphate transport system permease protein [Geoalkalibacter ferrihydriticus]